MFYSLKRSGDIFNSTMKFLDKDKKEEARCFFGREYLLNTGFIFDYLENSEYPWDSFIHSCYGIDYLGERPIDPLNKTIALEVLCAFKDLMDELSLYDEEVKDKYEDESVNPEYIITPYYGDLCNCISFIKGLDEDDEIILISS